MMFLQARCFAHLIHTFISPSARLESAGVAVYTSSAAADDAVRVVNRVLVDAKVDRPAYCSCVITCAAHADKNSQPSAFSK